MPCVAKDKAPANACTTSVGECGGVHQFGVPLKAGRRDSANIKPAGKPQIVLCSREAKDNMAGFVLATYAKS